MIRRGRTFLIVSLLVLCGCASAGPPIPRYPATFPVAEYERLAAGGTASIAGQAFLRTRGGEVRRGAGSEVTLDLDTSYSRPWWECRAQLWAFRNSLPPDPQFLRYRKTTTADADGHFKFSGLPAGRYLLRSAVVWEVPGRFGSSTTGGLVYDAVELAEGEQKEVILTWK
jgi:hypothetical protein